MNIKNVIIGISVLLNLVLGVFIYRETEKDEAVDVGVTFKEAVRVENYALAKSLIADGRKKQFTEQQLKKVNELMSAHTSYKTYQLLQFDNSEMVLLQLSPDGKYKIQDLVVVPEELRGAFK